MTTYISIGEAARLLGVTPTTLRRWHASGKLVPTISPGGHRRYRKTDILGEPVLARRTVAYARVSSRDQQEDLKRQEALLAAHCAAQGWEYEAVTDLGSGMNYKKKGLQYLLNMILEGRVERLVLTHKDRLLRFGAELVFSICDAKGVEVVILNRGEDTTFEQDLANDVLEIITVFSARLYGSRSGKNKKLLEEVNRLADQQSP